MPDDATEGVAEHSCFRLQPSINLHAQLMPLCSAALVPYPMYYPKRMKARVGPLQSIEPHRILAPTRDSNQGPPSRQSRIVSTILPLHTVGYVFLFL